MSNASDNNDEYLRIRLRTDCPCGSKKQYADCCHLYHSGHKPAPTPEALMRSRYSAYFFRLTDYLVHTQHPDTREPNLETELKESIQNPKWRSLQIIQTSKGTTKDKKGKVEFIAQYHLDGKLQELHEKSRFQRHKGKWKYYDARG